MNGADADLSGLIDAGDEPLVMVAGRGMLAPRRGFADAVPHPSTGRPLRPPAGGPSSSSSLPGSAAQQVPPQGPGPPKRSHGTVAKALLVSEHERWAAAPRHMTDARQQSDRLADHSSTRSRIPARRDTREAPPHGTSDHAGTVASFTAPGPYSLPGEWRTGGGVGRVSARTARLAVLVPAAAQSAGILIAPGCGLAQLDIASPVSTGRRRVQHPASGPGIVWRGAPSCWPRR